MGTLEASWTVEIAAPRERCYEIAADIAGSPEWNGTLEEVEVLQRDPEGRALVVETLSDAMVKKVRSWLRFAYDPPGGLTWEQAADALEGALELVVAHATDRGVALALEHTNSLRPDIGFVHRLRDAIDLARRLGIGVCMETNACWLERGLDATVADGVDTFRLVQVSDFVLGTVDTPNRAVPGDGDIPLRRILGQVVAAGYTGAFDLEIIGPRIEQEGYESAVPRSVENVAAVLDELGA